VSRTTRWPAWPDSGVTVLDTSDGCLNTCRPTRHNPNVAPGPDNVVAFFGSAPKAPTCEKLTVGYGDDRARAVGTLACVRRDRGGSANRELSTGPT
jgi:hypothetical protein